MGAPFSNFSWQRDWPGAALVAAALVMIAPLWCVDAPAMPDYPAHLASFFLIGGGASAFYHVHWVSVPNLASEMIVPVLARLTGLTIATKLFLSAGVAMWVLGPGAISRALHGRVGIGPLFGAVFAYNANFLWGFFNYYFAAGLSFVLFALWIMTAERRGALRLTAFAIAITLLYFCHIFAAASLGLMLTCYEISAGEKTWNGAFRRVRRVIAVFVPAALAFLFLKPHGNAEAHLEFNLLDTMLDRFESLSPHSFDDPAYLLPLLLFAGLAATLLTRRASIHPAMRLVLAAMLAGSLLAPEWALGGWAVHLRLPACFAALLFASIEWRARMRLTVVPAAAFLALIAGNAAALAMDWSQYDRQYSEFRQTIRLLPPGRKLLTVLDGDALGDASDQPYWHMAEFAVIDRNAMTALLFATRGQHVVQLNPPLDRFAARTAQQGSPPDIGQLDDLANGITGDDEDILGTFPYLLYFQCHYDEAVVIHLGGPRQPIPDRLVLRHAGSFFSLYDIKPDGACARR